MTTEAPDPEISMAGQGRVNTAQTIRKLGVVGSSLLIAGLVFFVVGLICHLAASHHRQQLLVQVQDIKARVLEELNYLNLPNPTLTGLGNKSLKSLLSLAKEVSDSSTNFQWFDRYHQQAVQLQLSQCIETLSKPISGTAGPEDAQRRAEAQIRANALPRLEGLAQRIEQAESAYRWLAWGLSAVLTLAGLYLLDQWRSQGRTLALERKIQILGKALQTQTETEKRREGATAALDGVMTMLSVTREAEHREALIQIGKQLEELQHSGRMVLNFAKSFHQLSAHGTSVARAALTSEQRNNKAESHMEIMRAQMEGLRADIRNAAQGLRKAGEVSRQLLVRLDPNQLELSLNEPDSNLALQKLVEQSQHALKESIEGLVLASQKINMGQFESNKLAEYMAVNQTAWENLLAQIEQVVEASSRDSGQALMLAKRLINQHGGSSLGLDQSTTPSSSERPAATATLPSSAGVAMIANNHRDIRQ